MKNQKISPYGEKNITKVIQKNERNPINGSPFMCFKQSVLLLSCVNSN